VVLPINLVGKPSLLNITRLKKSCQAMLLQLMMFAS
jgi:hypothetical protein